MATTKTAAAKAPKDKSEDNKPATQPDQPKPGGANVSASDSKTGNDGANAGDGRHTPTVIVTATANRRRAGRAFPKGVAVPIPVEELNEKQFEALNSDPVLAVSIQ